MKRFLLILTLFVTIAKVATAQVGDDDRIRDKMREYIQKRLNLNANEAERFTPVFVRYFKEWRSTLRENKGDRLILQQKIVELRIRYRGEFREIIGEKRSNQVYENQERFIQELKEIRQDRLERRRPGLKTRFAGGTRDL